MLYLLHEASQLLLTPARLAADLTRLTYINPLNPSAYTPGARVLAASCELFERTTSPYPKPAFNLPASERVVWQRPFCRVVAFGSSSHKPKVLIVAPMSGHYATLLRGTVAAFLDSHQVFITDWSDAKQVPSAEGRFDLSDYVDYCIEMFEALGPDLHVMAVCQPAVPVLAAIALMEAEANPGLPRSATLLGGPVDTRTSPAMVNSFAQQRQLRWFERHCVHRVPDRYRGRGRIIVYVVTLVMDIDHLTLARGTRRRSRILGERQDGLGAEPSTSCIGSVKRVKPLKLIRSDGSGPRQGAGFSDYEWRSPVPIVG